MKPFPLIAVFSLLLPASIAAQSLDNPDESQLAEQCLDIERDVNFQERIVICGSALETANDPDLQARLLIARAIMARVLGDYADAEADIMRARDLTPDSATPYRNMSYLEDARGNLGLAMNWALRAAEIDPTDPLSLEALLYLHVNEADPTANCPSTVNRVLQVLPPQTLESWSILPARLGHLLGHIGICQSWQEQNSEALIAYRAAEAIGLDEDYNRSNMALSAYFIAEDEFAQSTALNALEQDEPHIDLILSLAGSYAFTGEFEAAADVLQEYSDFLATLENDEGVYNVVGWQAFLAEEHEITNRVMTDWINWFSAQDTPPYPAGHMWDTVAQGRSAVGDVEGAMEAFALSIEQMDPPSDQIAFLRHTLERLGYAPGAGDTALMETLRDCVETGAACRLVQADDWVWPSLR